MYKTYPLVGRTEEKASFLSVRPCRALPYPTCRALPYLPYLTLLCRQDNKQPQSREEQGSLCDLLELGIMYHPPPFSFTSDDHRRISFIFDILWVLSRSLSPPPSLSIFFSAFEMWIHSIGSTKRSGASLAPCHPSLVRCCWHLQQPWLSSGAGLY